MSLSELLVIIIVGVLLLKPDDLPKILRKIKEFQGFINTTKGEILSHFNMNESAKGSDLAEDINQVNFYLEKISSLGEEYVGEYSLAAIKAHHRSLVKKQIAKERKHAQTD